MKDEIVVYAFLIITCLTIYACSEKDPTEEEIRSWIYDSYVDTINEVDDKCRAEEGGEINCY